MKIKLHNKRRSVECFNECSGVFQTTVTWEEEERTGIQWETTSGLFK